MSSDSGLMAGGSVLLCGAVALLRAGHPQRGFWAGDPRWWALPVALLAATGAATLSVLTIRRARQVPRTGVGWKSHLFTVLLFCGFLLLPVFWLLWQQVGMFSLLLTVPYALFVAGILVFVLRRAGVLQ